MLVLPFFAEQNHNAIMVIKFGIGRALNKAKHKDDLQ
jgi:UDP:flavonoid glycosyltransferase YjiC (YdhE family)